MYQMLPGTMEYEIIKMALISVNNFMLIISRDAFKLFTVSYINCLLEISNVKNTCL